MVEVAIEDIVLVGWKPFQVVLNGQARERERERNELWSKLGRQSWWFQRSHQFNGKHSRISTWTLEPVVNHILLIGNCNHISVAVIPALCDIMDPVLAPDPARKWNYVRQWLFTTLKECILCIVAMVSSCTIYFQALGNTLSLNEHIGCFYGEIQSSYESRDGVWHYETIFCSSLEAGWLCEWEKMFNCLNSFSPDQFYHFY